MDPVTNSMKLRYDEETKTLFVEPKYESCFSEWHAEHKNNGKWYLYTDYINGESRLYGIYKSFRALFDVAKTWV